MKNLFNRLLDALNISGRDWVVLILSLLLAFSVWLIHNLALKYNANLTVKVIAECNLDGHENISAATAEITARGRATGYNIIEAYIRSGRPVKVKFSPAVMQNYADDRYFVTSDRLGEYSHMIFGEDVSVEHYITDTVFFRFPSVNYKKVPVVPVTLLSFRDQYMSTRPLEVSPDSVVVEGEPYMLETVKQVFTKPIRKSDICENLSGTVPLEKIKGVSVQTSEIFYSLDVARYVEITVEVPVTAVNVPSDKNLMVFPSIVTVSVRCEFPLVEDIDDNIFMQIDYNDFKSSVNGNCNVVMSRVPKGVISYEVDPVFVNCVEETR